MLNSNISRGSTSTQVAWLRSDLAANSDKACTLAYWHHPRFSSALHGNDTTVLAFWDALYEFNADVIQIFVSFWL
ncbi:Alkaline phosphatase precursor [compost metagenome]